MHYVWVTERPTLVMAMCYLSDNKLTSSVQCEPAAAHSRLPWPAGFWPWPRQRGRSWCWSGRPGTGSACSSGLLCCCCGASALWASFGSWSGSLRDLKSFFPGWTRQRRRTRGTRRRMRDIRRTAGGMPSHPGGSRQTRPRRSGPRLTSGRRTGNRSGTGRSGGTGCRSVCTGPRGAAGSSGRTTCCVLWDQHRWRRARKKNVNHL